VFTGIVEAAIPLHSVKDGAVRSLQLDLAALPDAATIKLGDSVALNGCCLTVAALRGALATFEAVPETLKLTSLGRLATGSLVNVERAMKAGARLDGHLVQGHVDSIGSVARIDDRGGEWRVRIDCGREFASQCVHKGSVCVDGISLTIAELHDDAFTLAIIPHTRTVTNIREWRTGTPVNLEADVIGKYVRRHMQMLTSVDTDLLRRAGFSP
jgi:riboflavin synthase